jgi:hypothetical protein
MVAMLDLDQSGKLGFDEFKTLLDDIAKWKVSFSGFFLIFPPFFNFHLFRSRPSSSFMIARVTTS